MAEYAPQRTVRTPWGNLEELRGRGLRPRSQTSRQEIDRNQRQRLFAAMVASVAAKGYEATTVADLLELSGVSRNAFYEHFRDKEECFLATYDALVGKSIALLDEELRREDGLQSGGRGALAWLFEVIASEPAAANLCFNDAYTAGKAGYAAVEAAMDKFALLIEETLAEVKGHERLPPKMAYGLLGGAQAIIQGHLRRGEEALLPSTVPDLWEWLLSYEPTPTPLRLSGRRPRPPDGGPPPFATYDQAERIIRGLAAASAEHGYPAVTIAEIATRASVSQATFYSHFANKDAALIAALDSAVAQMLAAMLPAGRRAGDWPNSVRASIGALCAFGATEPDLVCLAACEAYAAGRVALDLRDRMFATLRKTLAPGFALAPQTKPIVADAVIGAAVSLFYKQIVDDGPQNLPELAPLISYMVLAPFLGAEQACDVANGDGRGGRA